MSDVINAISRSIFFRIRNGIKMLTTWSSGIISIILLNYQNIRKICKIVKHIVVNATISQPIKSSRLLNSGDVRDIVEYK